MTEKYAKIDASPSHSGLQSLTDSSTTEDKASEVVKTDTYESAIGFKKFSGIGRKLSLNASGSNTMESNFEMKEVPSNTSISESKNQEPNQDSKYMPSETVTNSDHDHDKKPPIISSKKLCLSRKNLQKEVPDSTKRLDDLNPSDLDVQKENLVKVQQRNQDSKEKQFEYSKSHVMSVSKSADNKDNKPLPAISSKKLCLSNKILQKEVPDSTNRLEDTAGDLDAQKVNMPDVNKESDFHNYAVGCNRLSGISRKLDASGSNTQDRDMGLKKASSNESLECSKDHVMTVKNSDHDRHTKKPTISSKKLRLSNKNLQKEVPDPTKRLDDVMPRDLGAQMENLLRVQKETDMPEYAVGSKRLSGISRKLSLDASGSNTRNRDTGMNKAPLNESQIQEPNQDFKEMPFEYCKSQVMTMINSDHDQGTKPPAVSSTKRKNDTMCTGLDAQKENLPVAQKKSTDSSCFSNPKRKKLGLTGKKPSFGFLGLNKNKENNTNGETDTEVSNMLKAPQADQNGANSKPRKLPRKPLQVLKEKNNGKQKVKADAAMLNTKHNAKRSDEDISEQEGLGDHKGVIVLDSEDSEEEMARSSSRRLISRRRLVGKI